MLKKTLLGLMAALVLATAVPYVASAQAGNSVLPQTPASAASDDPTDSSFQLIPCDGVAKAGVEGSKECDYAQLMALFNRIISFLLYLSIPLVMGMIMYTAFTYLTANGNPGKIADAKKMLIPVALGIFWIFAGFILVKTVLQTFLADEIGGEKKDTFINRFLGN